MISKLSLTELADGVYAWLQPGGESGVSNAGVVVEDDGITDRDSATLTVTNSTLVESGKYECFSSAPPRRWKRSSVG